MHSVWPRLAAATVALFLLVSGAVAHAEPPGEPARVKVDIHLIDVSDFDITTGTYLMDFYMKFECETTPCEPGGFELTNGTPAGDPDLQRDENGVQVYRIRAELKQKIGLQDFPFDSHVLQIVLEDRVKDTTELVYVPGVATISPDAQVTGWNLEPKAASHVDVHDYQPMFAESYSRFTFSIFVGRPLLAAILKGLFPAVVLMISGLLSLLMPPGKAVERLGLITSALVGAVLFHLALADSVPSVPYLTWADRFMIVNYLVSGLTLAVTGALVWLEGSQRDDFYMSLDSLFRRVIPSLWLTGQLVNLLLLERLGISGLWAGVPLLLQAAQVYWLARKFLGQRRVRQPSDHAA